MSVADDTVDDQYNPADIIVEIDTIHDMLNMIMRKPQYDGS